MNLDVAKLTSFCGRVYLSPSSLLTLFISTGAVDDNAPSGNFAINMFGFVYVNIVEMSSLISTG